MDIKDLEVIAENFIGKGKVSIVERDADEFFKLSETYLDLTLEKILKFYGGKNIVAFGVGVRSVDIGEERAETEFQIIYSIIKDIHRDITLMHEVAHGISDIIYMQINNVSSIEALANRVIVAKECQASTIERIIAKEINKENLVEEHYRELMNIEEKYEYMIPYISNVVGKKIFEKFGSDKEKIKELCGMESDDFLRIAAKNVMFKVNIFDFCDIIKYFENSYKNKDKCLLPKIKLLRIFCSACGIEFEFNNYPLREKCPKCGVKGKLIRKFD